MSGSKTVILDSGARGSTLKISAQSLKEVKRPTMQICEDELFRQRGSKCKDAKVESCQECSRKFEKVNVAEVGLTR
jgi:hypothetical protein